jgi:ABC-2 type transport system ATP-binding protein
LASHVQLAGDIEEIQRTHKRLIGPSQDEAAVANVHTVIEASHTDRQTTLLVRTNGPLFAPSWDVQEVSLEDMVLAYLSQQAGDRVPAPQSAREEDGREVLI